MGVCLVCRTDIFGSKHQTRTRYCGRCYDLVEEQRLALGKSIRKIAIRRVRRALGIKEVA